MRTQKRIIGDLGEGVTCNYLKDKGFEIIERNYWKPWGEIDIIVKKKGITHFIEVKTVSRENLNNVACESNKYNPEDNLHPWKLKRLSMVIQSYLLSKNVSPETADWQFDIAIVYLDVENRKVKVKYMEDIIL